MAQVQESYIQPYSNEAESAVLGALILESESYYEINQLLTADMFYNEKNQKIYQTLSQMHKNNVPVDMLTLVMELQKNKLLDEYLNPVYITQLTDMIGSSVHIKEHAMYIKQEYIKREVMKISQQTLSSIISGDDIADILSQLSNEVNKLEEGSTNTDTLKHISQFTNSAIGEATNRVLNYRSGVNNGVTTGLSNLDKITGGWQKSDLVIVAARPAMGKTAMAIKFLESAALSGSNVAMFALEMKGERLIDRIILEKTGIQDWKYKRGSLTNKELMLVEDTSNELFKLPVYIDDNSSQTISKIKSKCRLLKKKNKCDLVIIDYLQLAEGEGKSNNREQEVSKISREAKKLAKSLDVPVIMLSQLSRLVETRADKRPQLSDLRESGAIEQDADMVCFIHRPDYYNQTLRFDNQEIDNGIELIISKYREGATGSVFLQHDGSVRNIRDYNNRPF